MSHLLPSNALFSPSIARLAASTARDWSIIDSWLTTKYRQTLNRPPPTFERIPATLRILLALATANESADDDRAILSAAEAEALDLLAAHDAEIADTNESSLRDVLLETIEGSLTREGAAALDSMAALAVATGTALPDPAALAYTFTALQAQIFETEQMMARTKALKEYVETEALPEASNTLHQLSGACYSPPAGLARQNLEAQRRIKMEIARLPELQERVASAKADDGFEEIPSLDTIVEEEAEYMRLLAIKQELDASMAIFQGLPTDVEVARAELEQLRADLKDKTRQRDAMFENLVEQETPRKPRR